MYFLGFGFHDDNLRRLRFFNPENRRPPLDVCSTHRHLPTAEESEFLSRIGDEYRIGQDTFYHHVDCNDFFHVARRL